MRQVYTLQVMCICQSPALLSSVLKATTAAAFSQSVSRLNSPFVLSKALTKCYYFVFTRHFSIYLWMVSAEQRWQRLIFLPRRVQQRPNKLRHLGEPGNLGDIAGILGTMCQPCLSLGITLLKL